MPPVVGVGIAIGSGNPLLGCLGAVALLVLDFLSLQFRRRPSLARFDVEYSSRPGGECLNFTAGGTADVVLEVGRSSSDRGRIEAIPMLPRSVTVAGADSVAARIPAGRTVEIPFRISLTLPGTTVLPGALLIRRGCFQIFRAVRFAPARHVIDVFPDPAASTHPLVARFLRGRLAPGERRKLRAIRGLGGEFAELREYRPPESVRHIDWKATARRARPMVREYEDPRELTLRLVLDASADLVVGPEFARAARLVGELALLAGVQGMGFRFIAYDESVVAARTLSGAPRDVPALLMDLVSLPRAARLRTYQREASGVQLSRRAAAALGRLEGRATDAVSREEIAEFLDGRYFGVNTPLGGPEAAFLADLETEESTGRFRRCERCRLVLDDDMAACPRCALPAGVGDLAPRAACLAAVLDKELAWTRGREVLVLVSAFAGGEVADSVASRIVMAATPYRRVHVVLPSVEAIARDNPDWPGALGAYPDSERTLINLKRLYRAERFAEFRRKVMPAGVYLHPLEDEARLEEIVAGLLMTEVLG